MLEPRRPERAAQLPEGAQLPERTQQSETRSSDPRGVTVDGPWMPRTSELGRGAH